MSSSYKEVNINTQAKRTTEYENNRESTRPTIGNICRRCILFRLLSTVSPMFLSFFFSLFLVNMLYGYSISQIYVIAI